MLLRFFSTVVLALYSLRTLKDHAQYDLFEFSVYSTEIGYMFFGQSSVWLVENFQIGIFSDTINATNVKLCMILLLIDLCLFIPLSITLTIFEGHSSVKEF